MFTSHLSGPLCWLWHPWYMRQPPRQQLRRASPAWRRLYDGSPPHLDLRTRPPTTAGPARHCHRCGSSEHLVRHCPHLPIGANPTRQGTSPALLHRGQWLLGSDTTHHMSSGGKREASAFRRYHVFVKRSYGGWCLNQATIVLHATQQENHLGGSGLPRWAGAGSVSPGALSCRNDGSVGTNHLQ
jgi:hypothetical protein